MLLVGILEAVVMCEWDVSGDTKGKWSLDLQFQGNLILFKVELDSWI
jgi:hypothetical protein